MRSGWVRFRIGGAAVVLGASALVVGAAPAAHASTITVDTTADVVNGGDGVTSLREAFTLANTTSGNDTIVLGSNLTYQITLGCSGSSGERANASGSFDHTDTAGTVTILGNGSTIAGCAGGTTLNDWVVQDKGLGITLDHVTVSGGRLGGLSRFFAPSAGTLAVTDSTVTSNGGTALESSGTVSLLRSHVDDNTGTAFYGPGTGSLTIVDSTVQRNAHLFKGSFVTEYASVTVTGSTVDAVLDSSEGTVTWAPTVAVTDSVVRGTGSDLGFSYIIRAGAVTLVRSQVVVVGPGSGFRIAVGSGSLDATDSTIDGGGTCFTGVSVISASLLRSTVEHCLLGVYLDVTGPAGVSSTATTTITDSHIDDNTGMGLATNWNSGAPSPPNHWVDPQVTLTRSTVNRNQLGLYVLGSLTLTDSVVADNVPSGPFTGDTLEAGGVTVRKAPSGAAGSFTMTRSTVSGNVSASSGGPGGVSCGPSVSPCSLGLSTVSGNVSSGGVGGVAGAAGVGVSWSSVVDNVGVSANEVGAGSLVVGGSVVGRGSVSGVVECVVGGGVVSSGYSVGSDGSCGLTGVGDVSGVGDPGLGALGVNGGVTLTRVPVEGSVLVDRVPVGVSGCSGFDQRGVGRPSGLGCEVGAVEVSSPLVGVSAHGSGFGRGVAARPGGGSVTVGKVDAGGGVAGGAVWSVDGAGAAVFTDVWVPSVGGDVSPVSVGCDGSGLCVVGGVFSGVLTAGSVVLSSHGGVDGFVVAVDGSGVPVWGVALGGVGDDQVSAVAVGSGRVAVAGSVAAPGGVVGGVTVPAVLASGFVAALAVGSGATSWVVPVASWVSLGLGVAVAGNGDVLFSGLGFVSVTVGGVVVSGRWLDGFVVRLSGSAGVVSWARDLGAPVGGSTVVWPYGVGEDPGSGAVVVAGGFEGGGLQAGGAGPVLSNAGSMDGFVAVFDPLDGSGQAAELHAVGSAAAELFYGVAAGSSGWATVGYTQGVPTFDGAALIDGPAGPALTAIGVTHPAGGATSGVVVATSTVGVLGFGVAPSPGGWLWTGAYVNDTDLAPNHPGGNQSTAGINQITATRTL